MQHEGKLTMVMLATSAVCLMAAVCFTALAFVKAHEAGSRHVLAAPLVLATPTGTAIPTLRPTASTTRAATATPRRTATVTLTPGHHSPYPVDDSLENTGPGPAGPLTGLPTRPDRATRRPVAVVIDNFAPNARPQTGLNQASLVFETLAEGGITRLLAVYLEQDAPVIGPVRSARIYFDDWAAGLDAIFGHAGGNQDALRLLPNLPSVANMDGLASVASAAYERSEDRVAPYNLYTSSAGLRQAAQQAGEAVSGSYPVALPHRTPDPYAQCPSTAWIDVGFSYDAYNVHWVYDRADNRYVRTVSGQVQEDANSSRAEAPSNVVVLFTQVTPDPDPFTPGSINVETMGAGQALYFYDGHVVKGSWQKADVGAPLVLLDAQGQAQSLDPGQTWIEVLPAGSPVTYQAK